MANQRVQGHNWERENIGDVSKLLNLEAFHPQKRNATTCDVGSARMFSKALDDSGIDIWFRDNSFPFTIQSKKGIIKTKDLKINVEPLIRIINKDGKIPCLFSKLTRKKEGAKRETLAGKFVTFTYEDALKLITCYVENKGDRR